MGNINRFYRSDVLDPFRRRCYTIPIVIHADAVDEVYRSVIAKSKLAMERATQSHLADAIAIIVGIAAFGKSIVHHAHLARAYARAYANLALAHGGQYRRRLVLYLKIRQMIWYLRFPFIISADIMSGKKTIRYAARRFLEEIGIWPAPGLDDTQLGESSLSLELHRAQIPDRRVPSL
jgi:hypothetical protein